MSFVERVATLFRECPNTWLDGIEIAKVGGCYAYRTRISDCRKLGMRIENRLVKQQNGSVRSEYRFVPECDRASLAAVEAAGSSAAPIESL